MKALSLFILFFSLNSFAKKVPYPKSMAAIGDSYSRAVNAGVSRKKSGRIWNFSQFIFNTFKAQLGIHKEFPGSNYDYPKYNWSTGTDLNVQSHWRRISELSNQQIKQYNAAISGAVTTNLLKELKTLNKWSKKNLKQNYPDYVTLFIGGNDVCMHVPESKSSPTTPTKFGKNVGKIVKDILGSSPKTKMMLVSLPNLRTVANLLNDQKLFGGLKTCRWIWEKGGICINFTLEKDEEKAAIAQQMIVQYNIELEKITKKYEKIYPGRIRVSSRIEHHVWDKDDFSIDCFHMASEGMKEFSDLVWRDTWWGTERTSGHDRFNARRIECGVEYNNKIVDRNFFYIRKGINKNLTSEVIYVTPKDPVYLAYNQHAIGKSELSIQNFNEKNKFKKESVWKVGRMIHVNDLAKRPLKLWFRTLSNKKANVVCKLIK